MITRRKFIALGSLVAVSFLFPTYLFSKDVDHINPLDINELLKSAKNFRKQGNNNQAKQIYQQIIVQYPSEIRAYDGMRKVLLSQKKKEWEVILMFKAALLLNPNNSELKQRLYKEYFNAVLGNKKIKKAINFNGRLLSDIKQKYETFVQNNPNNKNLQDQYAKISRLLEWNVDSQNPNSNSLLKSYRKSRYKSYKKRFQEKTTVDLEGKLNELLSKPVSPNRTQHIRELYNLIVQKHRKEKNNSVALNKALSYYNNYDKKDPLFLKYIRDLSKLQNSHDALITIEQQNHASKNTYWSALALLDANIRKAVKTQSVLSGNVNNLVIYLESKSYDPRKNFELITRKIKIDILQNQNDNAKQKILDQCKKMIGITNPHYIDQINVLAALYYKKIGDQEGAKRIINIALNPQTFTDSSDVLTKSLAHINIKRSTAKVIHIQNLNKLLNKI